VRGRTGNPNIILKDFALCDNFVLNKRIGNVEGGWMPIVPMEAGQGQGLQHVDQPPAAIIKCDASSEEELIRRCSQPRLRGLVRLSSMGTEEAIVLNGAYRNLDTDKLLVIHEGKEPAGVVKWLSQLVGGVLLCIGGLGLVGWGILRNRAKASPT
jgi:hypothetical protein